MDHVGQHDLAGLEAGDLAGQARGVGLQDREAAGRDVDGGEPVADVVLGRPAAGMPVRLFAGEDLVAEGVTDADGRCRLVEAATAPGAQAR